MHPFFFGILKISGKKMWKEESGMKSAYFVPVSKEMSADDLQKEIKKRKEERAEKKPYILLAKMVVPAADFEKMTGNISSIELHRPWSVLSTETEKGAMLCVLIQCKDSTRNILVYTGGYDSPCFASMLDLSAGTQGEAA